MGARFLIAHPDTTTTRELESMLRDGHHTLRVSHAGLDAIDRALDDKPDAIILGVSLPGLDGLEVARALRSLEPTRHIPILFLAHDAQEAAAVERAGLPLVDCLVGPLGPERWRDQSAKLLRGRLPPPEPRAVEPDRPLAAITDPLTGMYMRHYLLHRLVYEAARAARYSTAIACILFGVHRYAELVQDLGSAKGDHLLVEIANLFRRAGRGSDVIGRVGDDEFLVIAPHTDKAGAQNLAMRLPKALSEHSFDLPGRYLPLHLVAGYASAPGPSLADNLALFGRAEAALLRARAEKGEQVAAG
jgi:two-component system, cell cycle response regulator